MPNSATESKFGEGYLNHNYWRIRAHINLDRHLHSSQNIDNANTFSQVNFMTKFTIKWKGNCQGKHWFLFSFLFLIKLSSLSSVKIKLFSPSWMATILPRKFMNTCGELCTFVYTHIWDHDENPRLFADNTIFCIIINIARIKAAVFQSFIARYAWGLVPEE